MNKREARQLAESGTLTAGWLLGLVAASRGKRAMSRVNPSIPFERVLDIYRDALTLRAPEQIVGGLKTDPYSGRLKPTRDCLTATNVLVDCAEKGQRP